MYLVPIMYKLASCWLLFIGCFNPLFSLPVLDARHEPLQFSGKMNFLPYVSRERVFKQVFNAMLEIRMGILAYRRLVKLIVQPLKRLSRILIAHFRFSNGCSFCFFFPQCKSSRVVALLISHHFYNSIFWCWSAFFFSILKSALKLKHYYF